MRRPALAQALISVLAPLALAALPTLAHAEPEEPKVNFLIVYGEDKCPESTDQEITVCARKDEGERYRIPKAFRDNPSGPANEAWTNRVQSYQTVGRGGPMSCSPVGPGGWTGCSAKLIQQAYAERKNSDDVHAGQLIAAERAKRLQTIDSDAAATQKSVEQAEKDYEARQKAAADPDAKPPQ